MTLYKYVTHYGPWAVFSMHERDRYFCYIQAEI